MAGCEQWKPVILMLSICFVFSVLNLLYKELLNKGTNHLVLIAYRQTASAIFLMPLAFFKERKEETKLTPHVLCYLFISALFGATLTQFFFLLGLQHTSAAFASAFINLPPANTFLIALVFRQEKLNFSVKAGKAKMLGSLVCIGGVILLILYQGFPINKSAHEPQESNYRSEDGNAKASRKSTESYIVGSICLISSSLLWSSWYFIQERIGKLYPCRYSSTAIMSFFSAIQSSILCFATSRDFSVWVVKGKFLIMTVMLAGIVGSGLGFVGMSWCVARRGPIFTAAFNPLGQIFVTILDLVFVHEQIYFGSVVGSFVVVCGLYTLLWGRSREAKGTAVKPIEAIPDNQSPTSSCVIQVPTTSSRCP